MNIPDKAVLAAIEQLGLMPDEIDGAHFRAIEAAAPYIAAQALRDAAWQAELDSPDGGVPPYWLRKRANEVEGR